MNRIAFIVVIVCLSALVRAETRLENFDKDPGWDGFQNRLVPKSGKTVAQSFGYSETNVAGKEKGEIGGTIWRSPTTASYADSIPVKTLNDHLSASGTFGLTATRGSSGA